MSTTDDVTMADFHRLTPDELRARGSVKWNTFGDALPLWVAEMDVPWAPCVEAAVRAAVDRQETGYPLPNDPGVTSAFAAYAREHHGVEVAPSDVVVVGDVVRAIQVALTLFSPAGAGIVIPTPSYPPMLMLGPLSGRPVHQVPLVDGPDGRPTLDIPGIDAALAAGGHTVLLTQPHNPTGRAWTRAEMQALAEVVEARGGRVVSDEIHAPLSHVPHVPYASVSPAAARHTITTTSAGKGWNIPGLRCALAYALDPTDAATLTGAGPVLLGGSSSIGHRATEAAYRHGETWRRALMDFLADNAAWLERELAERLPELRWHAPEATYFSWLDLRGFELGERPAEVLLRHGLALNDGADYGEVGRGWVRLNFACPRPILAEAVDILERVLHAAR